MAGNEGLQLLELFIQLLQTLLWPVVALVALFYFGPTLRRLLQEASEISFSAGGVEGALKKQQIEAAALLGAASAQKEEMAGEEGARDIARMMDDHVKGGAWRRLQGASLLWVDDRPDNNLYERRALEALGIHIAISRDTEDALDALSRETFDLVISGMSRPPDERAGYTLLQEMRAAGYGQPFVIYAGSNRREHRVEARQRGAVDSVNNPRDLFQLVLDLLSSGSALPLRQRFSRRTAA